jgi:hypothetical protein
MSEVVQPKQEDLQRIVGHPCNQAQQARLFQILGRQRKLRFRTDIHDPSPIHDQLYEVRYGDYQLGIIVPSTTGRPHPRTGTALYILVWLLLHRPAWSARVPLRFARNSRWLKDRNFAAFDSELELRSKPEKEQATAYEADMLTDGVHIWFQTQYCDHAWRRHFVSVNWLLCLFDTGTFFQAYLVHEAKNIIQERFQQKNGPHNDAFDLAHYTAARLAIGHLNQQNVGPDPNQHIYRDIDWSDSTDVDEISFFTTLDGKEFECKALIVTVLKRQGDLREKDIIFE